MQKRGMDEDARWWKVIDLNTGEYIANVLFADDETGEYDVFLQDNDGHIVRGVDGPVIERRNGNIRLVELPGIRVS